MPPLEGALSTAGPSEARLSGEAPQALPVEGVLNRRHTERSEAERGGSTGFACGGGAEPL